MSCTSPPKGETVTFYLVDVQLVLKAEDKDEALEQADEIAQMIPVLENVDYVERASVSSTPTAVQRAR